MKIGLISDTHSSLDIKVPPYFHDCHQIWHAGDIGDSSVAEQLKTIAPLKAVYGNIDTKEIHQLYPENNYFIAAGLRILITHIAGSPPKYNARVKKFLRENEVDILVCGHSHILKVMRDPANNLLFINPGAAGIHGFHKMKTIMTFEISEGKVVNMKVIELGSRSAIISPKV